MSSTAFTFDTEDLFFALFDQLDAPKRLAELERYADLDEDTYRTIIEEGYKFAREIVANAVIHGGFPPLLLDPIDFVSLFQQRIANLQAQQPSAQA